LIIRRDVGQKQNEREIGYFYNLYKEESCNSRGASSLTNLGAAARGRKRKRKKGEQGKHNGLELFSHGGFINLSVNPTFNGQLISSLTE
jgi:hypothetical protein